MAMRHTGLAVAAALAALVSTAAVAVPAEGERRAARDVVVRGVHELAAALRIATRPAWEGDTPRDVALIVDVTRYTARWDDVLADALFALEGDAGPGVGWRIAALGEPFGARMPQASLLATQFVDVLAHETAVTSTDLALGRTLRSLGGRGAVVVYLADWHFEDDHDLETLLGSLRTGGHTLSVVGSEAAFGRGWNDGFAGIDGLIAQSGPYVAGIGRNPFGGGSHDEPWHGGDTAYPHLPWRFGRPGWETEFGAPARGVFRSPGRRADRRPDRADDGLEDLRERLRGEVPAEPGGLLSRHPLPAAWGPYGLMRLAAETDGHYVLWSWNPEGRSNVRYDYARCDLFPPDLRSRDAIRADLPGRDLAVACLRAWHTAAARDVGSVTVTPPLSHNLRSAREMQEVNVQDGPAWSWRDASERDRFVRRQGKALGGLDRALADLDHAIAAAGSPPDDVDLRHLADAHLLAHTLRAQRFGIAEAVAAAREVADDVWEGDNVTVVLQPRTYIERGDDPGQVRARFEPQEDNRATGGRLLEERRHLLERYRGTPHGEGVARNEVSGYRATRIESGDLPRGGPGRNPADSSGTPPAPTRPGGGSGSGGGPATGR